MNNADKKLQDLKKDYIGEIVTIEELDDLSKDRTQWDKCYTYKNFLEEGCRAICDYPISKYECAGIWAEFDVVDKYDKEADWEDLTDVQVKITGFVVY